MVFIDGIVIQFQFLFVGAAVAFDGAQKIFPQIARVALPQRPIDHVAAR